MYKRQAIFVVNVAEAVEELYVFLICAAAEYPVRFNAVPAESVTSTVIEKSVPWSMNKFAIIAIKLFIYFISRGQVDMVFVHRHLLFLLRIVHLELLGELFLILEVHSHILLVLLQLHLDYLQIYL